MANYQLPPLKNSEEFEHFVCDLFNLIEKTNSYLEFQLFGVKGQNQKGIDIVSQRTRTVIQCKLKDTRKTDESIRKKLIEDIEEDLAKITALDFQFERIFFTSTFRDDAVIQEYLNNIKEKREYSFTIQYLGWDSLSNYAENYEEILEKYFLNLKFRKSKIGKNPKNQTEFLRELYAMLRTTIHKFSEFIPLAGNQPMVVSKSQEVKIKLTNLSTYFDKNRILLSENTCQIIDEIITTLNTGLTEIEVSHLNMEGKPSSEMFLEGWNRIEKHLPKMITTLESQFRNILTKSLDEPKEGFTPNSLKDEKTYVEKNILDLFLLQEQQLAEEKEFNNFRDKWFDSELGCVSVANSVEEIFNLIKAKYDSNAKIFSSKNIDFLQDTHSVTIQNKKYGCRVKIVNFDKNCLPLKIPSDLFLEILLFEMKTIFVDAFITESINRICLLPDINNERKFFWKDIRDIAQIYNSQEICNQSFELLINQIRKN